MSINELVSLVPPPASPSKVPSNPNWAAIEKKLGLSLPDDYKNYVLTYGSGLLGNFIIVANPFSKNDGVELLSVIAMYCDALRERKENEGEEGVPFNIYPDSDGLLPWGGDENGNGFYWLTIGPSNQWHCVVIAGRDNRNQHFAMPMSRFLAKSLGGEINCRMWPSGFANPKRRRVFTPY